MNVLVCADAVLSPGVPSTPGDEPESLSAAEQRLFHLQRQLDIETKVHKYSSQLPSRGSSTYRDSWTLRPRYTNTPLSCRAEALPPTETAGH